MPNPLSKQGVLTQHGQRAARMAEDGYTAKEIGVVVGATTGAVHSLLFKLRKRGDLPPSTARDISRPYKHGDRDSLNNRLWG